MSMDKIYELKLITKRFNEEETKQDKKYFLRQISLLLCNLENELELIK